MSKAEEGVGRKDLVTLDAAIMPNVDTATYRGRQIMPNIEALADSIAVHGQEEPGGVRRKTDGSFALIYGHRRFAAISLINSDPEKYDLPATIPYEAKVLRITHEEAMLRVAEENIQREDFTAMDKAIMASMLESVGQTREQIAARLKETPARIGQLLALLALPQEARAVLSEGGVKESALRAMLKAKNTEEEILEKLPDLISGKVKGADLAAEARERKRAAGKKQARTLKDVRVYLATLTGRRGACDLDSWIAGDLAELPADTFAE